MRIIVYPTEPYKDTPDMKCMKVIRSSKKIRESYASYLSDESHLTGGMANELVFVYSEEQIAEILRGAFAFETPVTISAGRTGVVGGAVPVGGTVLVLENMNLITGARWNGLSQEWTIRVQPGLSLEGLRRILDNQIFNNVLSNKEENSNGDFQRFAAESHQWFFPIDPTEKSAQIGGIVATNASGPGSFKYGQMRNYVVALRVVLSDGTVLSVRRGEYVALSDEGFSIQKDSGSIRIPIPTYKIPEVKSVAGYFVSYPMDLIDFFIGSEGTLGVITEVELLLCRKPEFILGGVAFFRNEMKALQFIKMIQNSKEDENSEVRPSVLEYLDSRSLAILREKSRREGSSFYCPKFPEHAKAAVYFEQEGKKKDLDFYCSKYAEILSTFGVREKETWGGIEGDEIRNMVAFRHAVADEINDVISQRQKTCPQVHKIGMDFVVPDSGLEKMFKAFRSKLEDKFEYFIFGHLGVNHFHVNIIPRHENELIRAKERTLELAKIAVSLGGTVSGEHGIGKIKKPFLRIMYHPSAIEEMKKVRRAFDPRGILNMGNIF